MVELILEGSFREMEVTMMEEVGVAMEVAMEVEVEVMEEENEELV